MGYVNSLEGKPSNCQCTVGFLWRCQGFVVSLTAPVAKALQIASSGGWCHRRVPNAWDVFGGNDATWPGGFQGICIFTPNLGERIKFDLLIFFKWVVQPPARWYLTWHRYHDDIWCDMIFCFCLLRDSGKKWHRWHYYFTYCETGFRRKHIDVWQFLGRAASAPFACLCRYEIHSGWLVGCCGIFRNPHDPLLFMACPIFHCGLTVWIAAWQFESSKDVFWERSWLCWCWAA